MGVDEGKSRATVLTCAGLATVPVKAWRGAMIEVRRHVIFGVLVASQ
jgi:hypothetical protein